MVLIDRNILRKAQIRSLGFLCLICQDFMKNIFVFVLIFGFHLSYAQQFYRIKADVSIKDKLANGTYRLTVGKAYYDKPSLKLIYKLNFPQEETIVIKDTTLHKIGKDGILISSQNVMIMNEFSIFHLSLAGKLADYGINSGKANGIYKVSKVEKEADGRIITT